SPQASPQRAISDRHVLMRALALDGVGGLDRLAVREVAAPELAKPDDVRIRVRTAGLNHLDLFVANGLPGVEYRFPHVVGCDAAGVVDAVGSAVRSVTPGDRVMINPGLSCGTCQACVDGDETLCRSFRIIGEHVPGTITELIVVPEANVARIPARMGWDQAAAFSLATLTAWRMLTTRAQLKPGEAALIWGIGGGVAQASLQIAKLLGAFAIVTSSKAAKLEAARAMGADATLDHTRDDVVAEVKRLTAGRGADVVVDTVGERTWPLT